jgi:hypothetical protein
MSEDLDTCDFCHTKPAEWFDREAEVYWCGECPRPAAPRPEPTATGDGRTTFDAWWSSQMWSAETFNRREAYVMAKLAWHHAAR